MTNDDQGNPMVVVKGNVIRKTNMSSSKVYKPMKFKIRGQYEVKAIQKLMNNLPSVGCNLSLHSSYPSKECWRES